MNTADSIVGKWIRIEKIRNILIQEQYVFYNNGIGILTITDNCDGYEEHMFHYIINSNLLYRIEHLKEGILAFPIDLENNTLMIWEKGFNKQYSRAI